MAMFCEKILLDVFACLGGQQVTRLVNVCRSWRNAINRGRLLLPYDTDWHRKLVVTDGKLFLIKSDRSCSSRKCEVDVKKIDLSSLLFLERTFFTWLYVEISADNIPIIETIAQKCGKSINGEMLMLRSVNENRKNIEIGYQKVSNQVITCWLPELTNVMDYFHFRKKEIIYVGWTCLYQKHRIQKLLEYGPNCYLCGKEWIGKSWKIMQDEESYTETVYDYYMEKLAEFRKTQQAEYEKKLKALSRPYKKLIEFFDDYEKEAFEHYIKPVRLFRSQKWSDEKNMILHLVPEVLRFLKAQQVEKCQLLNRDLCHTIELHKRLLACRRFKVTVSIDNESSLTVYISWRRKKRRIRMISVKHRFQDDIPKTLEKVAAILAYGNVVDLRVIFSYVRVQLFDFLLPLLDKMKPNLSRIIDGFIKIPEDPFHRLYNILRPDVYSGRSWLKEEERKEFEGPFDEKFVILCEKIAELSPRRFSLMCYCSRSYTSSISYYKNLLKRIDADNHQRDILEKFTFEER